MESIEGINKRLVDYYGLFENGSPRFRVVWSDSQMEMRKTSFTEQGIALPFPEIREMKKYPYIKHLYVLEQLVGIDYSDELVDKVSYEPVWVFVTEWGDSVPPKFEYIRILVDTLLENIQNKHPGAKYKIPESEMQTKEAIEHRVNSLEKMLFGNESSIGDALSNDSAVGYGIRSRNDSRFKKVN